jgi:Asp-tRNA(Asn)/Glu-tRNA(Gln) amidotransferase A subunit family amidase
VWPISEPSQFYKAASASGPSFLWIPASVVSRLQATFSAAHVWLRGTWQAAGGRWARHGYHRILHSPRRNLHEFTPVQPEFPVPCSHSHSTGFAAIMTSVLGLGSRKHWRDCTSKQRERDERIALLRASGYDEPLSADERHLVDRRIESLVAAVRASTLDAHHVLKAYGKVAIQAHQKTNCLTEVMVSAASQWIDDGSVNLKGPLAGIPVSLKDTIVVGGFDATVGYSSFVGNKVPDDGPMVRLLKDAGAVPYVKTNVPITLLSFESANDVWGRSTNPHNAKYSPGGSTGGEAALLALGGRIGIGSDVAGSVRVPAHFSGIYSLRCSTGRWPKAGTRTSMPGQEGIPSVCSPMARTMDDLLYFTRSVIRMEPWKYDYTVHPLAWRDAMEHEFGGKMLKVGIMRTDGVVDPSPACTRALQMVEGALRNQGHQVVEVDPPSPLEALRLGSRLLNADGCQMFRSFFSRGEWEDAGARQMSFYFSLPRSLKYLHYLWVKFVRRDDVWASLIRDWHAKTAYENWQLVAQREAYRLKWFDWWNESGIDILLTPPNATPAVPHDGMKEAVSSCGYTFLFNLVRSPFRFSPRRH